MKLILTGATGFAGGEVLKQALADPAIERVTVLTRRPLGLIHTKVSEVIVRDFLDYSAIRIDADACIWCLGVSQSQVGKEQYVVITHDYAVAAAAAMIAANPRLRFCFVSGRSADPTEKASQLYARIKAAPSARSARNIRRTCSCSGPATSRRRSRADLARTSRASRRPSLP